MLVIATTAGADGVLWRGRRHDSDGPGASAGDTVAGLFDCVFGALHDGEQVALGFAGAVQVDDAGADAADALLTRAETGSPQVAHLGDLLAQLGNWRPWTVISTSLPRWRATTSVLVWGAELDPGANIEAELDGCVEALFALARDAHPSSGSGGAAVVNLVVAAAMRAGLTVDRGQLTEPVLRVAPARQGS